MARGPTQQDLQKSTEWGLAGLKSIGAGLGVSVQIGMYDLVCRTTFRAHRLAIYSGTTGIGLPVSGSFTNDDYTYFRTQRPVSFADFDRTRATITGSSAGIYSLNTVRFFDKAGNQLGYVATSGFGLSIPELGSGGEGRTEIYYGNGRPVEDPEWIIDVKIPTSPEIIGPDRIVARDQSSVLPIPGDVLFEFGKAELTSKAVQYLGQAGLLLIERSGTYSRITVEGHTDSVGGKAFNKDLSRRRAETVRRWLEEYVNSSPRLTKRFKWEVEAHGEEKPVAPNNSAPGRAKNRRVELVLWER